MNRVQSIDRAFQILERVATAELGLTEIAEEVALPKSTVARLLSTLASIGAVEKTGKGSTYRIGHTVRGLVATAPTTADLVVHARPYLRALARDIGEDAGVSVPVRAGMHYVAQENANNDISVKDWTGFVGPYHLVPAGLVILAWSADSVVERVLSEPMEVATEKSVTDPEAVRDRLLEIRSDGYAWVFGEFSDELNSIAAPVFGLSGVIGAIGVHGPAYRFPQEGGEDAVAARVVAAADQLSAAYRRTG